MKNLLDQVDLEHGKFACFRGRQEIIGPKSFKTSEECHPPDIRKHPSILWSQNMSFPYWTMVIGGCLILGVRDDLTCCFCFQRWILPASNIELNSWSWATSDRKTLRKNEAKTPTRWGRKMIVWVENDGCAEDYWRWFHCFLVLVRPPAIERKKANSLRPMENQGSISRVLQTQSCASVPSRPMKCALKGLW